MLEYFRSHGKVLPFEVWKDTYRYRSETFDLLFALRLSLNHVPS